MRLEIITTGDEVMQGVIVDTNTAWVAERAARLGHVVVRHTAVGDDAAAIGEVLRAAAGRVEAVVVTGGLGPTADDLTIAAAAEAFGLPLVRDEAVLADIRERFARVGREMSVSNEKQALIPEGGLVLENRVGSAPGIALDWEGTRFYFLPGVPKELYQIFSDAVEPWLAEQAEGAFCERILRCFGLPEATIDTKLADADLGAVRLGFRVKFPEVLLKLTARGDDAATVTAAVDTAEVTVRERLGDAVYAVGEASLAGVVVGLLSERGLQLAVAESCTGGEIADRITDVPGASAVLDRGLVTYSNRSKEELLGVPAALIAEHGAVSEPVARAMAEGVREQAGVAVGVGITGIAGPTGGTPEKPVGTVHIAVAAPGGTTARKFCFNRDRIWFKQFAAAMALDMVRRAQMTL